MCAAVPPIPSLYLENSSAVKNSGLEGESGAIDMYVPYRMCGGAYPRYMRLGYMWISSTSTNINTSGRRSPRPPINRSRPPIESTHAHPTQHLPSSSLHNSHPTTSNSAPSPRSHNTKPGHMTYLTSLTRLSLPPSTVAQHGRQGPRESLCTCHVCQKVAMRRWRKKSVYGNGVLGKGDLFLGWGLE
jgi:hypothetical protein